MEEETVGEILNRLLSQKGMSQRKLAILSGVDRGYINSLVKGKAGSITLRIAKQLAGALNVPPEIFLKSEQSITRQETPEEILDRLKLATPISIPVYTDFPFHAGEFTEPIEYVYRARPQNVGKNIEGYLVQGKCLEPVIQDNDIIIIDRDVEIGVGKIVACCFEGKMVLGRLILVKKEFRVENYNMGVKFEDCEMCAVVIEVIRRLT